MRLALISDEASQDMDEVVETVTTAGFQGVEVRSVDGVPPHLMTDDQVFRIRQRILSAGLEVAGFCPPAMKCGIPTTDAEIAQARTLMNRAVRQTELLGARHLRAFSFYRDGPPDPVGAAKYAALVLEGVDLRGVDVLIETGMRTNTPTLATAVRFVEEIGKDLGILWDPGNSVFSGIDLAPFPNDYEIGYELIRHVHVKDTDGSGAYVRIGDGLVPWPAILERLYLDDFTGWISLETHWRRDRVLSQPERDEPWGTSFSAGGVPASLECMKALSSWVDRG